MFHALTIPNKLIFSKLWNKHKSFNTKGKLPNRTIKNIKQWEGFKRFNGTDVDFKGDTDYHHTVLMEAVSIVLRMSFLNFNGIFIMKSI